MTARLLSLCVAFASCAPALEADLTLAPLPRTIEADGTVSTIGVVATDAAGKPGTGKVRLTSALGSLAAGVEVSLVNGTASADFTCNAATDPTCVRGPVRLTADWVADGKLVETITTVTLTLSAPDAGPAADCLRGADGGVPTTPDALSIRGTLGALGPVSTRVFGSSSGPPFSGSGFRHLTTGQAVGLAGFQDATLTLWANAALSPSAGLVTSGAPTGTCTATTASGCTTLVDLRVTATPAGAVACPAGAPGTGQLTFVAHPVFAGSYDAGIAGTYSFSCPDAGIAVSGCFRYSQ